MPDFAAILAADEFENSPLATVYYNVLNELVNERLGDGRASDVLELVQTVERKVFEHCGVKLEREFESWS